jgi:hypothetical protein
MSSKRRAPPPPPAPRAKSSNPSARKERPRHVIDDDKKEEQESGNDEKSEASSEDEVRGSSAPSKAANTTKATSSNKQTQKQKHLSNKTEKEASGTHKKQLAKKPKDPLEQQRKAEKKVTGVDSDEDPPPLPASQQHKGVTVNLVGKKPASLFNAGGSAALAAQAAGPHATSSLSSATLPPGTVKPSDVFKQAANGHSSGHSPATDNLSTSAGSAPVPHAPGKFVTTIGRSTLDGQQERNLRFALTSMQGVSDEALAILDSGGDPIEVIRSYHEATKCVLDSYLGIKLPASSHARADSDVEDVTEAQKKKKKKINPEEAREEEHGFHSITEIWEALAPVSREWFASIGKVDVTMIKRKLFESTSLTAFVRQMFIWSFPTEQWLKLDDVWPGEDRAARQQLDLFYSHLRALS